MVEEREISRKETGNTCLVLSSSQITSAEIFDSMMRSHDWELVRSQLGSFNGVNLVVVLKCKRCEAESSGTMVSFRMNDGSSRSP
jgi:hypothetical protein